MPEPLSEECIKNRGICCEARTPPMLLPSEIKDLVNENVLDDFIIMNYSAKPKGVCPFFKEPLCTVYEKRPVDCITYPVSIRLVGEIVYYVVDANCPGVKKKIVSIDYINNAVSLWQKNMPSLEWIREYCSDDPKGVYNWITIEDYFKD